MHMMSENKKKLHWDKKNIHNGIKKKKVKNQRLTIVEPEKAMTRDYKKASFKYKEKIMTILKINRA